MSIILVIAALLVMLASPRGTAGTIAWAMVITEVQVAEGKLSLVRMRWSWRRWRWERAA